MINTKTTDLLVSFMCFKYQKHVILYLFPAKQLKLKYRFTKQSTFMQ